MKNFKRIEYKNKLYDIIQKNVESRPIFTKTALADKIIEEIKEDDDHLTILFKDFINPMGDRDYTLLYSGIELDIDAITIAEEDDRYNAISFVKYAGDNPTVPEVVLNFMLSNEYFVRIANIDIDNNVFDITTEQIPPYMLNHFDKHIMDVFPIVTSDEKVELINGALTTVSEIKAYLPAQLTPVLFDIITTPIGETAYGVHDSKVNAIKSKIRYTDLLDLTPGSVISHNIQYEPNGLPTTNLYLVEELADDHIRCSTITPGTTVNTPLDIRYKHMLDDNLHIIPYYNTILIYPRENPILYSVNENSKKININDICMYIDNIMETERCLYDINAEKINNLIQKKLDGKRIDKKRNKTVGYIIDIVNFLKKSMTEVEELANMIGDDRVTVYDTNRQYLKIFPVDGGIFLQEYEKLTKILTLLGVSADK